MEIARDIVATASLVMKLNPDSEIFDTQTSFIAFINELGFRTMRGKEWSKMNFRNLFRDLSPSEYAKVRSEFTADRDFDMFASNCESRVDLSIVN